MTRFFSPRPTPERKSSEMVPPHVQASKPRWVAEESVTEAVQTVQAWWTGDRSTTEAVAEGTVQEENTQVPRSTKEDVFMSGLLGAGALSPGATIGLCILLL